MLLWLPQRPRADRPRAPARIRAAAPACAWAAAARAPSGAKSVDVFAAEDKGSSGGRRSGLVVDVADWAAQVLEFVVADVGSTCCPT
eukprot:SAG31_NODE_920_length_10987_cov_4.682757_12_plen_86_part_01